MNPSVGDIIRFLIVFDLGNGVEMINLYTAIISALNTADWDAVLDEGKIWLADLYSDWAQSMAPSSASTELRLSLRDTVNGQWDEVAQDVFTSIVGSQPGTTLPSPNTGSIVAYTAQPRYRGRKGLPPPAEDAVGFGVLGAAALADLALTATRYVTPYAGIDASWTNGVLSEATETFRPFTGNVAFSDVLGTQVTRKIGRGM